MPFDVFISYSSQDKIAADAICSMLERNGIGCWIAPRDILPGQSYGGAIIEAISSAHVMVLVFSRSANASPQVEREVEAAVRKGLPVLPVRIEDVKPKESLEFFISVQHWLDAFTPPMEPHLVRLAAVIKRILPPASAPTPAQGPPPQAPIPAPIPIPISQPQIVGQPPPPPRGVLFVTLVNPKTRQRVQMKTGFSGSLFIGSSFLGLPLFGIVFFSRKLYGLGTVYLFGSFIFYLLVSRAGDFGLFLMFISFCVSIWLGLIGNKITARNFIRRGWTILDDGTGVAQAAKQRWKLPLS